MRLIKKIASMPDEELIVTFKALDKEYSSFAGKDENKDLLWGMLFTELHERMLIELNDDDEIVYLVKLFGDKK